MKTWEEAEFDAQQESIKKWAEKKYKKIVSGRRMKRKLNRLRYLAEIITGDPNVSVSIEMVSRKNEGGLHGCRAKEMRL